MPDEEPKVFLEHSRKSMKISELGEVVGRERMIFANKYFIKINLLAGVRWTRVSGQQGS